MAAWAIAQVGTPWVHQGRVPFGGLDCVGLPVCDARAHGIAVADMLEYSETPDPSQLMEYVRRNCEQVASPVVGGLLVFWIGRREITTHAGIYVGETSKGVGRFVHARRTIDGGTVRVGELTGSWGRRLASCWRYK